MLSSASGVAYGEERGLGPHRAPGLPHRHGAEGAPPEQERIRREVGPGYRDHDLVFCQPDGSWWNPPAISLAFGRAVKRAKAWPCGFMI